MVLNVTNVNSTSTSFATVYPGAESRPLASDLNFGVGQINPNMVQVKVDPGSVNIYNDLGSSDFIVDVFGFFAPGPTVSVSANPSSISANGTDTSTITVTVTDADGNGVAGDAITLAMSGAACGTLNSTTGTTNSSGQATFTYTASHTTGNCVITATEGDTGASNSTTVTQTTPPAFAVNCTPTSAPPSTGAAPTQGNINCTASGLPPTSTVDLALFPTEGANAPAKNGAGNWTFKPSGTNEALGEATSNGNTATSPGAPNQGAGCLPPATPPTCNAYIASINSTPTANAPDQVNGINTGPSGSFTFVLNSFTTDGAVPVVWQDTDGDNTLGLDPATHEPNEGGTPNSGFGIGQFLTWAPPAAPTGATPDAYYVQSVDHAAKTFVGCPDDAGNTNVTPFTNCLTFTYNQSGSTYCYQAGGTTFTGLNCSGIGFPYFQISLAQFDSWLTGFTAQPSGATNFPPAVPGDDIFVVAYNASGPSQFVFDGGADEVDGDVPAMPTGLAATSPSAGLATLNWTGPNNPDVANNNDGSAKYRIWRMPNAACVAGKWGIIATTNGGTSPPATTFADGSACVMAGGTFTYAVAAVPDAANGGTNDIGPLSNQSTVNVIPTPPPTPVPPVSTSSVLTQGTNVLNNNQVLDAGDTLQFIFANVSSSDPLTIGAGAGLTVADNYGEQSSIACNGVQANCSVSNAGTQLNIALLTNPTQINTATAGSGSPTPSFINTDVGDAVVSANGFTNSAGNWNLAVSGFGSCDTPGPNGELTLTRMFDGTSTTGNTTNGNNDFQCGANDTNPPFNSLPFEFDAGVQATVPNTVHLNGGDFCCGAQTGDPVTVYNANGVAIGNGIYNNASGTTITTTSSFNNGDQLYVVYQDTSGIQDNAFTGPSNQPSHTLEVPVLNYHFSPKPIAPDGSLGNSQNVTVNLSGVTPNGVVWLKFTSTAGNPGSAMVSGTPLTGAPQAFTANGAGQVQIIYTSSSTSSTQSNGVDRITACTNSTCSGATLSDTYTYTLPVSAGLSTVTNDCGGATPDNDVASCHITVTLNDTAGNPKAGKDVQLSGNAGTHSEICNSGGGNCQGDGNPGPIETTNGAGQVVFSVKDNVPESVVYTAMDTTDGITVTQTTNVQFFQRVNNGNSTITATPPGPLPADGSTATTIQVTVRDDSSNPISGYCVTLSQNGSATIVASSPSGAGCGFHSLLTDTSGRATWTSTDTVAQTVIYTATGPSLNGGPTLFKQVSVTFTPTAANSGTSSLTTTTPPSDNTNSNDIANDNSTLVTLTATFKDVNGNPRPGDTVKFTSNSATAEICVFQFDSSGGSTCSSPGGSETVCCTNSSGQITQWGRDITAEAVTFTATDLSSGSLAKNAPSVTFGVDFVTGISVFPTNLTHSATGVQYTVHFTTTAGAMSGLGNHIWLVAPAGTTFPSSGYTVKDDSFFCSAATVTGISLITGSGSATPNEVEITFNGTGCESAGDSWTVTITNVTNTNGTGGQKFSMYTSGDSFYVTKFGAYATT